MSVIFMGQLAEPTAFLAVRPNSVQLGCQTAGFDNSLPLELVRQF